MAKNSGNSLQDQLQKAGLANRKQAVKAQKAKNTREKMVRKGHVVVDEVREAAEQADATKREKDKALNREREAEANRRAIAAQIDQLVSMNRIEDRGDVAYSFTDSGVIRSLSLRREERDAAVRGALAIARLGERFELIPRKVAMKIAERDAARLVAFDSASDSVDVDDEYAGYEVPDDLMW